MYVKYILEDYRKRLEHVENEEELHSSSIEAAIRFKLVDYFAIRI